MPETISKGADELSLLEDASTLLLFSKAGNGSNRSARSSTSSSNETNQQKAPIPHPVSHSRPLTRSPPLNGTVSPRNPLASPGPASVALLHNESTEKVRSNSVSSVPSSHNAGSNINNNNSTKGIVAAAALAAAATVPLPLKTEQQRKSSMDVIDIKKEAHKDKKKSQSQTLKHEWPVLDSYIVDIDSGIISCICGFNDDDGFTIQCDHCNRWQHAICYNIKDIETAPDDYLCNACEPRKLDVRRARRMQLERLQNLQLKGSSPSTAKNFNNNSRTHIQDPNTNKPNTNNDNNDNKGSHSTTNMEQNLTHETVNFNSNDTNPNDDNNKLDVENEDENKKKRNHDADEELLANDLPKKKKDNVTYMNAKEAYSAMYLPIDASEFKDKYVKLFIDKHNDDDWVIPYHEDVFKPLPVQVRPYSEVSNIKIFPGFTKLGLYLMEDCNKNDLICEFLGEVDFQKNYLHDPRNHYRIWGTSKPRVLFHPHWPLHIDARLCGNIARYMRRSCNPNVELATIRMPSTNELKFVLRAIKKIDKGEEIHINWQWDLRHPIWQIINGTDTFDSLNDPDKYLLIHSIDTVLGASDCACGSNSKDCNLLKVKKFSQSLYRSVKSKMNNRYKLNEILNQYQGKRRRQPPILTILTHESLTNQEKAPQVLADFNAERLLHLEVQKSKKKLFDDTGNDADSEEVIEKGSTAYHNVVKPYRWILSEKEGKRSDLVAEESFETSSTAPTVITNPSDYDESKIDDLDSLPVPIVLELPIKQHASSEKIIIESAASYSSISNDTRTKENSLDASALVSTVAADKSISAKDPSPAIGRATKLEDESNSSSTASLTDLHHPPTKNLKKKLSFADYRKKINK